MNKEQNKLYKVINALEKVNIKTKKIIFEMVQNTKETEIVFLFNQNALDLFNILHSFGRQFNIDNESVQEISYYKYLFENAIKINIKLPINNFALSILEYAPEIYSQNEDIFLNMMIPNINVNIGDKNGIIKPETIKSLWKRMSNKDKEIIKDKVILLTMYAHTYLYQTSMKYEK